MIIFFLLKRIVCLTHHALSTKSPARSSPWGWHEQQKPVIYNCKSVRTVFPSKKIVRLWMKKKGKNVSSWTKSAEKTSNYRALCCCHCSLALAAFWHSPPLSFGWVIICFEVTLTALVISPSGWLCVRDGEWLTSAELEKQQVPHLGYGSQTPPPPDRRKTWHRRPSFPRPAHTGREGREETDASEHMQAESHSRCEVQ